MEVMESAPTLRSTNMVIVSTIGVTLMLIFSLRTSLLYLHEADSIPPGTPTEKFIEMVNHTAYELRLQDKILALETALALHQVTPSAGQSDTLRSHDDAVRTQNLTRSSWPREAAILQFAGFADSLQLKSFLTDLAQFRQRWRRCRHPHTIPPPPNQLKDPKINVCLDGVLEKRRQRQPCYVVSIGIANIWSFDDLMLKEGCTVYSVDPSMGGKPEHTFHRHSTRHKFFSVGIGAIDGIHSGSKTDFQKQYKGLPRTYTTVTLQTLMKEMGTKRLDIVRMDCEGAEWHVLEAWLAAGLLDKMDQLLFEIHMTKEDLPNQLRTLSQVFNHVNMVSSQRNPYSPKRIQGTTLAPVWELGTWSKQFPAR
jgi:hypothetical protein